MDATNAQSFQKSLKTTLKRKYHKLRETSSVSPILPARLCMKEDRFGLPSIQKHEFLSVDKSDLHTWLSCSTVPLADILNCDCKHGSNQRTLITYGVCGVGKTTVVHNFALDWAEGSDHQDIDLLFPFSLWEFNLIKHKVSLIELIQIFYPHLKRFDSSSLNESKIFFVFDGLDEYLLSLNFRSQAVSDICERATVDTLLTNLIKGNLLPNAHLWITTREVAATKIPDCYLLKKTEVQGFDDEQKELHIRTLIGNERLSRKVINHVKISRSLNFLCQIPPVCTIMATALKNLLKADDDFKITPMTLTQIYKKIVKMSNSKFISKLKALALHRMEEQVLDCSVLYQEDLLQKKMSVEEASVFSKESPLVLREEKGLYNTTVFRFGHLSVQEFLAADCKLHEMSPFHFDFLALVDQTLVTQGGKYDVFLRFIFGLIKEKGYLEDPHPLIVYTGKKVLENILSPSAVVLFHCLREFDSQALLEEVNVFMNTGLSLIEDTSPTQWAFMSQRTTNFEGVRQEFHMPVSERCDEQLLGKLPVLFKSENAMLRFSNLTNKCCPALASILSTKESYLKELDLGYNSITDTGVKMLMGAMASPSCKLKRLSLLCCGVTAQGCRYLANALKKDCRLKELDLSGNNLGDSGLKHLAEGLEFPHCCLEELKISQCNFGHKGCCALAMALQKNSRYMKVLNLAINAIGDEGAIELFKRYDISQLHKLEMNRCGITMLSCKHIGDALKFANSNLVELNLSNNRLTDAGFGLICAGMRPQSHLEKLNVSRCGITTPGCFCVAKVLACVSQTYSKEENKFEWPEASKLMELNLTMNCLEDAGIKQLLTGLTNPYSHFTSLNLTCCDLTDDCCTQLASILASEDSMISKLDLSDNDILDKGVKKLCVGLRSTQCTLEHLALTNCGLGSESVEHLIFALKSNPNYLTELFLMGNKLTNCDIMVLVKITKKEEYALNTVDVSEY
ncbi:NACHT, LRR and PYD domains-containing protein 3-like isoform X2 [Festucalex cinctus]